MNHLKNKWWLAATAALAIASFVGARAVMAQEETSTPPSTVTAAQETPAADETPPSDATPDADAPPADREDGTSEKRAGGCGKFVDPAALAGFLGVTAEELRTELQADGATLATVAEAHGQSRDALIAFMTQEASAALDAKVADGTLTQAEADERLAALTANIGDIVDGSGPFRGFHSGGLPGGMRMRQGQPPLS
ncbi:MAG: hypothetical protein WD359_05605 [Dehalococcoidia bacterium]